MFAENSNGNGNGNGNSGDGNGAGVAREPESPQSPQSPQVRNLLSFLSPQHASAKVIAPHLYRTGSDASPQPATADSKASQSFGCSYYSYFSQPRRIKKPRGLQLEMSEMREIVMDRSGSTVSELSSLQREYDSAGQRLDELRRAELKQTASERSSESRKLLLARCNRDVSQVRDRMHFSDSAGLLGRRVTQRWSNNELILLQTILNRAYRDGALTVNQKAEQHISNGATRYVKNKSYCYSLVSLLQIVKITGRRKASRLKTSQPRTLSYKTV